MKSVALTSEELNKKKSLKISIILHTTILLILMIPFLNTNPLLNLDKGQIIIAMDFSHSSSSAKNKAAAKAGALPKVEEVKQLEAVEEKTETEVVEETPQKEAEPIVSETEENEEEVTAAEEETEVVEDEIELENEDPSEENAEESQETAVSENSEADVNGKSEEGNSNGASELDEEKEGEFGDNGDGEAGFDESGDGIFGRQIIKHAALGAIMKKSGKIVVKVCINKLGRVKEVSLLKEESTITERDILQAALEATTQYLFERDQEAPALQCGKITFVLDIENDNSFFSFFE
jgi:outer membrane biosynthesis protein TonB